MPESEETRPAKPDRRHFAELLGVSGLAIAQPLLAVFGNSADQFVVRRASPLTIVVFAALVVFVVPVLGFAIESMSARVAGHFHGLHRALLGAIAALGVVQSLRTGDFGLYGAWAMGAVVGGILFYLLDRMPVIRTWARYMGFGAVGFLMLFFLSPTGKLVYDGSSVPAEVGVAGPGTVPGDIVMVVVDELPTQTLLAPNGEIDSDLFPGFARLADDATFYRNHTTVADRTLAALPALVTGRLPDSRRPPTSVAWPENVFALFSETHDVHADERFDMCAEAVCGSRYRTEALRELLGDAGLVLASRLNPLPALDDAVAATGFRNNGIEQLDRMTEWVGDFSDGPGADFHFLHIIAPHAPFQALPSGNTYYDPEPEWGQPIGLWCCDYASDLVQRRHFLQAMSLDTQLARLWNRMDELGVYDDSIIVVVADHGVAYGKGMQARNYDDDNASQVAWSPLLIKAAGQRGGSTSDVPVTSLEVVPTVADLAGVDLPWDVDGEVVDAEHGRRGSRPFLDWEDADGTLANLTVEVPRDGLADVLANAGLLHREGIDPALWPYLSGIGDELVGRRVSDLGDLTFPDPADRSVENRLEVELVTPSSIAGPSGEIGERLHVYVRGRLSLNGESVVDGTRFAVVVGGRVGAVGETFTSEGEAGQLDAIVPEQLLAAGSNEVEILEVRGGSGETSPFQLAAVAD